MLLIHVEHGKDVPMEDEIEDSVVPERNAVIAEFDIALLMSHLGFPRGVTVLRAFLVDDAYPQRLMVVFEGSGLPRVSAGDRLLVVRPVFDAKGFVAWSADSPPEAASEIIAGPSPVPPRTELTSREVSLVTGGCLGG